MNERTVRVDCEGRMVADANLFTQATWRSRSGHVRIPRWDDYRDYSGPRGSGRQSRTVEHPRDEVYHTLALCGATLGGALHRRTDTPYGAFAWRHPDGVLADMLYRYRMRTRQHGDAGGVMATQLGADAYLAQRERDDTDGEHLVWAPF